MRRKWWLKARLTLTRLAVQEWLGLLLEPKLRLLLLLLCKPGLLWYESILELVLTDKPCWLGLERLLEALLVQFGQALSRGSNGRTRLRDACQLRLQRRRSKAAWLREILRSRERPLGRRRKEGILAHHLRRGLRTLPRR